MFINNIKQIVYIFLAIVVLFGIHQLLFLIFDVNTKNFKYPLEIMYLFFLSFSIITAIIIQKVKEKNIDIVGNVFLLVSSTKMIFAYLLIRPVLNNVTSDNSVEKWNFFSLFIVFLVAETLFVIYLLNQKSKNSEK